MKIIKTHVDDIDALPQQVKEWAYNGFDVTGTHEIFPKLQRQLDNHTGATYNFSKSLQAPVLEMQIRGVRIDHFRRDQVLEEFYQKMDVLERQLDRIVLDGVGLPHFSWQSPKDMQHLFYTALGLPVQYKQRRPTVDLAAREKLFVYQIAQPIISTINLLADLQKKMSILRTAIDRDGRIRTTYNIAGTSTGRFSSSASEFGTGTNLQNIEESLRSIFIADPKMKFAKCDAKSGESYCVGSIEWNLFGDGKFLDVCESGDVHTAVAKVMWPELAWTGDPKEDKRLAERPYYRHYDRRFMCKKIGHGSNYAGQPETLSEQSRVPLSLIAEFQPRYFREFPAHQQWHVHVKEELRRAGHLISLMGRKRWFFGRRTDPDTQREAIAYDPQSSLADIVNLALIKLWRRGYTIMMHDHDALTFQYPEEEEDEIIPQLMSELIIPVQLDGGRELRIPYDCATGWNKGKYDAEKNPNGLRDYNGHDSRVRETEVRVLDRRVHLPNLRVTNAGKV